MGSGGVGGLAQEHHGSAQGCELGPLQVLTPYFWADQDLNRLFSEGSQAKSLQTELPPPLLLYVTQI